jgi:hypothetical protein
MQAEETPTPSTVSSPLSIMYRVPFKPAQVFCKHNLIFHCEKIQTDVNALTSSSLSLIAKRHGSRLTAALTSFAP